MMGRKTVFQFRIIFITAFILQLLPFSSYADMTEKIMEEARQMEAENKLKPKEEQPAEKNLKPTIEYTAGTLKDPFQKPTIKKEAKPEAPVVAQAETSLPSLTVEGIMWGGTIPQAIINGKVVKIDDEIGGARVVYIDKEGVILSSAGRQFTVSSPSAGLIVSTNKLGG
jgi:type II secretory pathway component PulC